jgi:hypothetical protein
VGDAAAPPEPVPAPPDSGPPGLPDALGPLEPAFCTGAGWTDPAKLVLFGSTEDSIVLVHADGTLKVVAPLSGATGVLSLARAGDYLGIQEFVSPGGLHVVRLDSSGNVLLDLNLKDAGGFFGSLRMDPDGTMTLGGATGKRIRILPDGTVEHLDAPPSKSSPPTPEGYLVLGPADAPGWQVVALPSSVIPLDDAFYETSTATLQRVRYKSDWIPNAVSKGRIVYLGTTPDGVALVDEGVAGATTTLLPGTMKWAQVYGSEQRVVVRENDVPVAWLEADSRAVTVLGDVIALMEAGAAPVGGGQVKLLVQGGVPRSIFDVDALRDMDIVSPTTFSPGTSFAVHESADTALVTADGIPFLWVDRRLGGVTALSRDTVLGGTPAGATSETLFAKTGALVVSGGLPRAFIDLDNGQASGITLPATPVADTKTHAVGDRAVVTMDGSPRFLINVETSTLFNIAPILGPLSYDSVIITAPWLVALSGDVPVFRVNVDSAEALPFAVAPLPLPYNFYDARFADDPTNHPAIRIGAAGGRLDLPAVASDGYVLSALRDDAVAGVYRLGPADSAWQSIGQPFHDVVWTSVADRKQAWVVESGQKYSCYCTWPNVSWASADAGASNVLKEAVQLIPRGGATPVVIEGSANLDFHSSDACVVVTPVTAGTSQSVGDPFAYDLLRGKKTAFDGVRWIRWIDAQ